MSCENNFELIWCIIFWLNDFDQKIIDFLLIYIDFGMVKVYLYVCLVEMFFKLKCIVMFKDGVCVEFFDELGKIVLVFMVFYGEIDEESGKMLVCDFVQFYNFCKEQ